MKIIIKTAFVFVLFTFIFTDLSQSYQGGVSGRTLKTSSLGCGGSGCHGSSATSSVVVTINGPDSIFVGQTASFTVTVTDVSGTKGGVNIAVSRGILIPVSASLKISNNELVHNTKVIVPSVYHFTFKAASTPGTDTMYATGKGTGFNSWNWAINKVIKVVALTNIQNDVEVPNKFELKQNYPNPFNPTTTIKFSIPITSFVTVDVFNVTGQHICTIINGEKEAGYHALKFDSHYLTSGVYYYRMIIRKSLNSSDIMYNSTMKFILAK